MFISRELAAEFAGAAERDCFEEVAAAAAFRSFDGMKLLIMSRLFVIYLLHICYIFVMHLYAGGETGEGKGGGNLGGRR